MFWNTRSIESNQRNTATFSAGRLQGSAGAGGSHTTSGHAALAADELEAQAPALRLATWTEIEPALKGRILVELHLDVRQQLIAASTMGELADALHELDLDELSDLYPQLPAAVGDAVLSAMDIQRREKFDLVRAYPDDSAGGLMDTDTLAVQPDTTLATAAAYLVTARGERGDLPRALDALNVVDADSIYLGRLSLVDLVSLDKDLRACDVLQPLEPIRAKTPAAHVARRFENEDLVAAPVVDEKGRLIGRITVDDVLDFVRAQAEHATLAPGGLSERTDTFAPAWQSARQRAVWLGVNLAFALLATVVIALFNQTIERVVALAILMPVVSSMGGVAGTQSLALVLRGLALEQIDRSNRWRLLRREVIVAGVNGLLWAAVVGTLAALWFGNATLSVVFAIAIVVNLVAGVVAGTLIPLVLQRLKIDGALAGEVLLVAFTDTFGFFVFLGLATLALR